LVVLSIPTYKVLGHVVVIIRNGKYELRLDRSTNNRPMFNEEELTPEIVREVRKCPGHRWLIIGETQMTDGDISRAFDEVINGFGTYHTVWNNCHHFVMRGCDRILLEPMPEVLEGFLNGGLWSRICVLHSTLRIDFYSRILFGPQG
jgi:hypothetical protein